MRFEEKARDLVIGYLENQGKKPLKSEIRIVWFCKVLQNWKAIVADLRKGGMLFEVTYNGNKQESYIDAYLHGENVCVTDFELEAKK